MIAHAMAHSARPSRSPTRYLAPLALAVAVLGIYVVSQHALGGGSSHPIQHRGRTVPGRRTATAQTTATTTTAAGAAFYVVKAGDNLSVISAHTGVPLPTLESLNPNVSSTSLQVGQRLRLRR